MGGGFDRVLAAASFTLEAGSEVEMFTTVDNLATAAINLTGNELSQYLYGNAGVERARRRRRRRRDVRLRGRRLLLHPRPRATGWSSAAAAAPTGCSPRSSFTLEAGSQVEMLTTIDNLATTAINLTGNALAQYLYGNAGVEPARRRRRRRCDDRVRGRRLLRRPRRPATGWSRRRAAAPTGCSRRSASRSRRAPRSRLLTTIDNLPTTAINLTGNGLSQYIYGNAGANMLDGKSGADVMTGFGGADSFAFTSALGGGNVDRVADFSAVDDTILLDDAVFAGLALGALNANAFVIGSQAGDADDRIIYNSATGALLFDADGNGAGAAVHFATVDGVPFVAASDFLVI